MDEKDRILTEFRTINGVGKTIAEDFYNLGLRGIKDLKGQSPDILFDNLCEYQKAKVDRCMLYVLRLAVYFAENNKKDPALLKWWNWSDTKIAERSG